MKIALAQINVTIGDFAGVLETIESCVARAEDAGATMVIFPELALTGYPPRDLLEDPDFIRGNRNALAAVAKLSRNLRILVGYVEKNTRASGKRCFNALALCEGGRVRHRYFKRLLPNYDVFDESRYFEPGTGDGILTLGGLGKVGVSICEDAWNDSQFWPNPLYAVDPLKIQAKKKAGFLMNVSASPFCVGKPELKRKMFSRMARRYGTPMIYVNLVGGNDELVFDGRSFAMDEKGRLLAEAKAFEEDLLVVDAEKTKKGITLRAPKTARRRAPVDPMKDVFDALVLGLRDYVRKCGFEKVVLGLSGGVDSTLVAILAAEALGPQNVLGVLMPSPYSSVGSIEDAEALARNLKIETKSYTIRDVYQTYRALFGRPADMPPDLADENVQARIRGNILMTLSNRHGAMVLTTGNKSELAMGYCTLYGDMSGGLAVISDLLKTKVYELCHYIQRTRQVIPPDVLTKAPSAELRPDQKDQDSLPPYETLDAILEAAIEEQKTEAQIIKRGFDPKTVRRVLQSLHRNEYKRRQAAPGLKITSRAFGLGRRYPLARKI